MPPSCLRPFASTFLAGALWLAFAVGPLAAQPQPQPPPPPPPPPQNFLGLLLASQQQMLGIPLASLPFSGTELPSSVDLSGDLPPPGRQGNQNSCVAWSLAYVLKSYQESKEERWPLTDLYGDPKAEAVFSPAFIYNQINNGRDGGSYMRDGLNVLSEKGAALWRDMPYRVDDYLSQPSPTALANARRFRIDYWRRVNVTDPREVKAQLHAGYPVVIGAAVDDKFIQLTRGEVWRTRGTTKGGHAMVVVGFDDAHRAFKVINSWGREWADGGYGWIDYNLFAEAVNEGYVVKDASNGPPPDAPVDRNDVTPPVVTRNPYEDGIVNPVAPARDIVFTVDHVEYNVATAHGPHMRMTGRVVIPPGRGSWRQSCVYFFLDAGRGVKGQPVRAIFPQFSDTYGNTATGTPGAWLPPGGVNETWEAWLPNSAFNFGLGWQTGPDGRPVYRPGTVYLVGEATLFIDNFGVLNSAIFPFSMVY